MKKLIQGCFIGFIATIVMDIVNIVIASTNIINKGDIKQVGLFVKNILIQVGVDDTTFILNSQSMLVAGGGGLHILTGLIYGCIFIFVLDKLLEFHKLDEKKIVAFSLAFGLFTVLAPFLIFQPVLGLGYFASESPSMMKIILTSIVSHSTYGIGLWLGYILCQHFLLFKQVKNLPA